MAAPPVRPVRLRAHWQTPKRPAARSLRISIKTSVPRVRLNPTWGDYHFARGLADAIRRAGHTTRIESVAEWSSASGEADLDLVLFGSERFAGTGTTPFIGWVIYPGRVGDDVLGSHDGAVHMFFASAPATADFKARHPGRSASVLMQAYDPAIMHPGTAEGAARAGLVFVGSNHFSELGRRLIVDLAARSGRRIRVWGMGWRHHPIASSVVDTYIDNVRVGGIYRGSRAVLCDHMPSMRASGFVSNRIYDALACGTPVICDRIGGIDPDFLPHVFPCETDADFACAASELESASEAAAAAKAQEASRAMRDHSFDARASEIIRTALNLI